jgi:hypothetical protein
MRSPWSEAYEDVTPPPTDEERESTRRQIEVDDRARERALARLATEERVPWVSLPAGLASQLIRDGVAEQDGVMYLRRKELNHG